MAAPHNVSRNGALTARVRPLHDRARSGRATGCNRSLSVWGSEPPRDAREPVLSLRQGRGPRRPVPEGDCGTMRGRSRTVPLGNPEWAADERFKDIYSRVPHAAEIEAHLVAAVGDTTPAELLALCPKRSNLPRGIARSDFHDAGAEVRNALARMGAGHIVGDLTYQRCWIITLCGAVCSEKGTSPSRKGRCGRSPPGPRVRVRRARHTL